MLQETIYGGGGGSSIVSLLSGQLGFYKVEFLYCQLGLFMSSPSGGARALTLCRAARVPKPPGTPERANPGGAAEAVGCSEVELAPCRSGN